MDRVFPHNLSILAIMQARVSSTRLPNKVLKPILNKPMFLRQVERVIRAKCIDKLIIATSTHASDDIIQTICDRNDLNCFRGSLTDVLDRFYQTASLYKPAHVLRLTADCPLADPEVIDAVIQFHLEGQFDYTNNMLEPSFPYGLDTEVVTFKTLETAWQNATLPSEREHVTLHIYKNPSRFKIGCLRNDINLSYLRWAVDEQEDFDLISEIYENLYLKNQFFTTQDILIFLDKHPNLKKINSHYNRYAGLKKSYLEDEKYLNSTTQILK